MLDADRTSDDLRPDFRHVESWVFDLDNTLYPADSGLFAQIDARMTVFVQNLLGVDAEAARSLQKAYYREHGTTLNGLMHLHGVEPDSYLSFVHDIDLSALARDEALGRALARLPGRRFIFTNGCRDHAARILERLDLARYFNEIWDIRTIAFRPKPDPGSYRRVLDDARIDAARAAMFEDAARNLVPAHGQGMTTVWLRNDSPWSKQGPEYPVASPAHIDYETGDLPQFLNTIRISQ
jgi:putative hydrolase of the HAD superfamily